MLNHINCEIFARHFEWSYCLCIRGQAFQTIVFWGLYSCRGLYSCTLQFR